MVRKGNWVSFDSYAFDIPEAAVDGSRLGTWSKDSYSIGGDQPVLSIVQCHSLAPLLSPVYIHTPCITKCTWHFMLSPCVLCTQTPYAQCHRFILFVHTWVLCDSVSIKFTPLRLFLPGLTVTAGGEHTPGAEGFLLESHPQLDVHAQESLVWPL